MTSTSRERRDQIGAFFAANATRLHNTVRAAARAHEAVIEDACQTAWTILLRRPDITLDERGLSWLATVAIRHTWRRTARTNEIPVGGYQRNGAGPTTELPEPAHPDDRSAEDRALARIEHAERVTAFATLKPREREALFLKGLGYSYHGSRSYLEPPSVIAAYRAVACVDDMSLKAGGGRALFGCAGRVWWQGRTLCFSSRRRSGGVGCASDGCRGRLVGVAAAGGPRVAVVAQPASVLHRAAEPEKGSACQDHADGDLLHGFSFRFRPGLGAANGSHGQLSEAGLVVMAVLVEGSSAPGAAANCAQALLNIAAQPAMVPSGPSVSALLAEPNDPAIAPATPALSSLSSPEVACAQPPPASPLGSVAGSDATPASSAPRARRPAPPPPACGARCWPGRWRRARHRTTQAPRRARTPRRAP